MPDFATFLKKKGFIYQSSEIYGGLSGFYDYGHLGTRLKRNFENQWRRYFLGLNDNFHEIETTNIMHANVFKASGHLDHFIDPIVNCSGCEFNERADHFVQQKVGRRVEELSPEELTAEIEKNKLRCPKCGGKLDPVSILNMMFPVKLGVGKIQQAYLRPETAQSPYINFKLQFELLRNKLPLGLALVGKAFRNEISPRNLTLRQREFTQAELQIFFNPEKIDEHPQFDAIRWYKLKIMLLKDRTNSAREVAAEELVEYGLPKFYVYHLVKIQQFYFEILQIPEEKFRFYELNEKEKAFYNKYHFDLEINLKEYGWTEVGGLHYRTDHDLKGHQKISGEKMDVFDEESGKKLIPHVLELSFGVDRNVYTLLDLNYEENKERGNVVLKLTNEITPFFCAVFPLVKNKPELLVKAEEVYEAVRKEFSCFWDISGSVGRRYARADEIGVNFCVTADFESLEDHSVTIRERDSTKQIRVKISDLNSVLGKMMSGKSKFETRSIPPF
ncbi:MAG TPA: glycine--tRNA ligase [Candidatus Nanoarchaeia archaeon]|nr:glycine--tRNA ligase [Candidatus Nanoarchaeia archaeon]